jgi:hypothetical protein
MLDLVIESRPRDLGGGLAVGRVLPFVGRRMVGPFIFLDHMGPAAFQPGQGIDVRPHPHIGLATVTYLFDGEIHHHDNLGFSQKIFPGEVNWMTAGSGIVHSERTDPSLRSTGGLMHGMQAWVALPHEDEETAPGFVHHDADALPELSASGLRNNVTTFSPTFYLHAELQQNARLAMPADHAERAVHVVSGSVAHEGERHPAGRLLVFAKGGEPVVTAEDGPARLMLLGGANIGPRFIWWNLVSSRQDRIEQAKADWKSGRLALPPDDNSECIPLPEDPPHAHDPTHPV